MASIKKARLLINYKNENRKLCKLSFVNRDASLFITPYGFTDMYWYGKEKFAEGETKRDITYKDQFFTKDVPKLSIHANGQVHIKADVGIAGPIKIPALNKIKGLHIATVLADRFDRLPLHSKKLKNYGLERDVVIDCPLNIDSGKIVIYVNSQEKKFPIPCALQFTLKRETLLKNLHFGIAVLSQRPLAPKDQPGTGMVILAGWDPTKTETASNQFLYLRGT